MKKTIGKSLGVALLCLAFTNSLFAGSNRFFKLDVGHISGDLDSAGRYGIGFEVFGDSVFRSESEFSWGLDFATEYSKMDKSDYTSLEAGFKPGYTIDANTFAYASLGISLGSWGSMDLYGWNVGAGVEYLIAKRFLTGLAYRHGFLYNDAGQNLDTDQVFLTIGIKY